MELDMYHELIYLYKRIPVELPPAHAAALRGDCAAMTREILLGPPPEGEHRMTLLHMAALGGNAECVEAAAMNADVNAKTAYGHTPLHLAVIHDHVDAVRALLKLGADKRIPTHDGLLPANMCLRHYESQSLHLLRNN
jgi:ankyrin repeat protein